MNKQTFHVSGTHCPSCKILIEDILSEQKGITQATVNLKKETLEVTSSEVTQKMIEEWNKVLSPHGYKLSTEKTEQTKDFKTLTYAIPLGLFFLALFFLLQKSGILNLGFEEGLTPVTALMIGGIASVSSCLAVVGGLVLSLSAKVSQDVSTARPLIFFHSGRLISFALLGGVLGTLGGVIGINATVLGILGLFAAAVMIILGIQLLDVFHFSKKLQVTMPAAFSKKISKIENGFWAPFIVGALTFLLPCGFTQAMQIGALSSGSFLEGMKIMTFFALGTFPVLALLSFGSFKFAHSKYAPLFFKTAGIIVIGLGIFAFLAGLAGLGIITPFFNI
jgi:sulfite exporter TauE/SafE/copper chaperone CopZ